MIDRILRLNGLFFTEIWTNNVSVTFYCCYLRKGTWRFHLYDGNYKITVLLGIAQARSGGGGVVSHIIGWGAAFFLVSLTAVFASSRKRRGLWPTPPSPQIDNETFSLYIVSEMHIVQSDPPPEKNCGFHLDFVWRRKIRTTWISRVSRVFTHDIGACVVFVSIHRGVVAVLHSRPPHKKFFYNAIAPWHRAAIAWSSALCWERLPIWLSPRKWRSETKQEP